MSKSRNLCVCGLLIALIVVLSSYFQIPMGASIRLDLGYAVVTFAALYLGAGYGAFIAFIARIINDLFFSGSVSFWWAIGSAFFGFAIGIISRHILTVKNTVFRELLIGVSISMISVISFAGIVPIIASCMGIDYGFMLGIGILASVADAIVAVGVGYPIYKILHGNICKI